MAERGELQGGRDVGRRGRVVVRIASGVAAIFVVAGCSSDGKVPTTPVASRPSTSHTSSPAPPPSTQAASAYPHDHLTGYGATLDSFATHHTAAADRSLPAGCCFGPAVSLADGRTVETWNVANSPGDIVTYLIHFFPTGTGQDTAVRRVERQDLPPDVQRVQSVVVDDSCRIVVYNSHTLATSAPENKLGTSVSIRLYSPTRAVGPPRYDGSSIERAVVESGHLLLCSTS